MKGEQWLHSRGKGKINIPHMAHIGEKEPEKPVFPHESIEHLMAGRKSSKKLWKTGLCVMDDPGLGWYHPLVILQVVPGRAGGGSFRRKKNYIAKKEFAYRMCARRPTSAMPKPFLCCERAFCCSMVVMWPVLMHVMSFDVVVMSFDAMWLLVLCHVTWCNAMWCALMWCALQWSRCVFEVVVLLQYYSVLHSTTTYYSSTTLYYKVLLQYYSVLHSTTVRLQHYSVLQSTTPVLLCTAKYYSSTTLQSTTPVLLCTTQYYNVLLQYYKVLLCTARYYSSTTLYYRVLLQYYSVLQSTSLYYTVLQRTTPVLPCTTKYYPSTTLYCKVLLQYYSVLQSTTPVLLCTTQYYNVLLQYYKVLLCTAKYYSSTTLYYTVLQRTTPVLQSTTLYCKVLLQYYSVLQSSIHDWSLTHMTWLMSVAYEPSFTMRGVTAVLAPTSPNTAPATQNDCDDWSASHMKRHLQCAEEQGSQSNFTKYCACHAKWISWLIRVSHETSFTMGGVTGITIQLHQTLRLPRKRNLMIDPHHIWNVI